MTETSPRISVVMPVYNGETFLKPAVDSILAQTERDFEFLIIDDGSTDGSHAILQAYADQDHRVRLHLRNHEGLVPALNFGIAEARAPYLARMDADDIALPTRFARQLEVLEADPGIGALGTHVEGIDVAGRPLRPFTPPVDHDSLDTRHLTRGDPRLWHPSVMMRTEILRDLGGYSADFPYTEDLDLWLRIAEVARLAVVPEVLLRYRLHLASVSVTKRDQQIRSARAALLAAHTRRGLPAPAAPEGDERALTEVEIMGKWAGWALRFGHRDTARHYAWRCLRQAPFAPGVLGRFWAAWRPI